MTTYTRYVFDVVKNRLPVKVKCRKCGKSLRRVLTEEQSINPYNKHKTGRMKTREDIYAENEIELGKLAKKALKDGIICSNCRGSRERHRDEVFPLNERI